MQGAIKQETHVRQTESLVKEIVRLIEEKKGENTVVLDLSDTLLVTDTFIITETDNPRQLRALARDLKESLSRSPYADEGLDSRTWAVLDYGSVVVHIFERESRRFYDLEGLWGEGATTPP